MQKVCCYHASQVLKYVCLQSVLYASMKHFAPVVPEKTKIRCKPIGILWHEAIMGRNADDLASAIIRVITSPDLRDKKQITIWHNCASQNKNWTLITAMTVFLNFVYGPECLTLKYSTKGHTFMSADQFHKQVEDLMKYMGDVVVWKDYVLVSLKRECRYL